MNEQASHLFSCSMTSVDIIKFLQMIYTPEFSEVEVAINLKRDTYLPSQVAQIPKGMALVNIKVPGTMNMPVFFGNFAKALNKK